ncbi:hypothetical protein P154DRAFT_624482 [Amniculicola lignicola CBS 123094]|uniref:NAD(P)-binding domain-containing protein n=1 Tax=Amniculicola lignicola CBS 123094 TaxID=1392246 RepID=A0A6A5W3M6_9PLEO|nr:hypothetical protein P154DRAFT_624482 [Amniculicola lignicola CBS 123094]
MGVSSQARIEHEMLPELLKRMDEMAQQMREGNASVSTYTTYANDDKGVWKEFRRDMVNAGIRSRDLRQYSSALRTYLMRLQREGLLEEDTTQETSANQPRSDNGDKIEFDCHDYEKSADENPAEEPSKEKEAELSKNDSEDDGEGGQKGVSWKDTKSDTAVDYSYLQESAAKEVEGVTPSLRDSLTNETPAKYNINDFFDGYWFQPWPLQSVHNPDHIAPSSETIPSPPKSSESPTPGVRASGYVATEVVRQALLHPSITSVVALARNPVAAPQDSPHSSKLKSLTVDYDSYSDDVKNEIAGADACIWTVAITPSKAKAHPAETVLKVNQEWALAGLRAIIDANPNPKKPVRFLYMSGAAAHDPDGVDKGATKPWMPKSMEEYGLQRGQTWTKIVEIAAGHKDRVDVCIAKAGFITGGSGGISRYLFGRALYWSGMVDTIDVKDISAAMLKKAVEGFEGLGGVLTNSYMAEIGRVELQMK